MELLIGVLGFLATIAAALFPNQISHAVEWLFGYLKKKPFAGLYSSQWQAHDAALDPGRVVNDYVVLSQHGPSITGETFYTAHSDKWYTLRGRIEDRAIYGEWSNPSKDYRGFFLWRKRSFDQIDGAWIGPDRQDRMLAGSWSLARCRFISKPPDYYFDRRTHKRALENLVNQAEETDEHTVIVDGISLNVVSGVFDPTMGRISLELYELLKSEKPRKVLDLGTGCGLYALHFARDGVEAVGLDISHAAVACAQTNAKLNGIVNARFYVSDLYSQVPAGRFDLICANLPFSREELCKPIRKSAFAKAFGCSDALLKKFIFQTAGMLHGDGSALFTFGSSGNVNLLYICAELAGLDITAEKVLTMKEVGETFLIFRFRPRKQPAKLGELGSPQQEPNGSTVARYKPS